MKTSPTSENKFAFISEVRNSTPSVLIAVILLVSAVFAQQKPSLGDNAALRDLSTHLAQTRSSLQ